MSITVAVQSKAWNVFTHSNTGIVGSNPTWSMDVCVYLFCVCVQSFVQAAALRWAYHLAKDSYQLCKRFRNWKSSQGPTKGCRAIERQINNILYRDGGTCWVYRLSHSIFHTLYSWLHSSVLHSSITNSSHTNCVDHRTLTCHADSRTVPYAWRTSLSTDLLCSEAGFRLSSWLQTANWKTLSDWLCWCRDPI
jgi:hypothetical protein